MNDKELEEYFDFKLHDHLEMSVFNAVRMSKYNTPEKLYKANSQQIFMIGRIGKKGIKRIDQFKDEYEKRMGMK